MIHIMNLHPEPFELIKSGSKVIEVRLNDEKRRLIKIGDTIEFKKRPEFTESLSAKVVGLSVYTSFYELFKSYPLSSFGYGNLSIEDIIQSMYEYYSQEDEINLGVIAIEIKK